MPLISVCIPVYKQKQYLQTCLESVLMQDFKDYEIVITDDTPDNSLEQFIKTLMGTANYRYYRNEPSLGSPANWNAAIQKAEGKYIKLLHHDDFFTAPDSLSVMVNHMEAEKADFLFCQTDVWHRKENRHHLHSITAKQFAILKKNPDFLFFKNMIGAPSVVMHINLKHIYDTRFIWLVDIEFYIRQIKQSSKIAFLNKTLVCTSHDIEGQVTGSVQHNTEIQIREYVLLFNLLNPQNRKPFAEYFDQLFMQYDIKTFEELIQLAPFAAEQETFFRHVIAGLNNNRFWKKLRKRFFESRYNNYIFKLEQYA